MTDDHGVPAADPTTDPDSPEQAPPSPPTPALTATGLGLMGGADWIFRDVDLTVAPGALAAVVGPAGSGRSSLLLTLAGRMRSTAGTLSVLGHKKPGFSGSWRCHGDRPSTVSDSGRECQTL